MRLDSPLSAAQLAALSLLGGLIAAGSVFLLISPLAGSAHHASHLWWAFVLVAALVISGLTIAYLSASGLESGIANDRWPEDEINSVRARIQSPLATAFALALFAAYLVLAFFTHRFPLMWFSPFIVLQTLNFLRSSVRLRSTADHEPKWNQLSPLRSDHWGQH
jgi:MFS family permease